MNAPRQWIPAYAGMTVALLKGGFLTKSEQLPVKLSPDQGGLQGSPLRDRGQKSSREMCPALYVYLETQVDFGGRNTAPDAPILGRALPQQNLDLIARDSERFEVPDDRLIEGLLRLK